MPEKRFKRFAIEVRDDELENLIGSLYEELPGVGYILNNVNGSTKVEFYLPEEDHLPQVLASMWKIEQIGYDDAEWLNDLRGKFKGVSVADVRILPPWQEHSEEDLLIYPGMAFGTGEHASTQLALYLLALLPMSGKSFLDVGTGSGILAIYAKKKGCSNVVGIDIDAISIENAEENAKLNNVDIDFSIGDAYNLTGKYDITCANLVTDLLLNVKDTLLNVTKSFLVLSGIPIEDFYKIENSYGVPYLAVIGEEWVSFLYKLDNA